MWKSEITLFSYFYSEIEHWPVQDADLGPLSINPQCLLATQWSPAYVAFAVGVSSGSRAGNTLHVVLPDLVISSKTEFSCHQNSQNEKEMNPILLYSISDWTFMLTMKLHSDEADNGHPPVLMASNTGVHLHI